MGKGLCIVMFHTINFVKIFNPNLENVTAVPSSSYTSVKHL